MAANTRTRYIHTCQRPDNTPTGTFGDTPAPLTIDGRSIRRWTPAEQRQHLDDLADAIEAPYHRPAAAAA
ncbi:hypothetical protein [Streptomyces sp. NPDC060366]|uniref:hypothetical protein n=1 Tax=Streptomyces sp. NPDC060366 TaxID=3347105 RepID=UPI0036692009